MRLLRFARNDRDNGERQCVTSVLDEYALFFRLSHNVII